MHKILKKLNEYLENASEEQLKKDWEELEQYNQYGPDALEFLNRAEENAKRRLKVKEQKDMAQIDDFIRVEVTDVELKNTIYFGDVNIKTIVEEHFSHTADGREKIAPSGIETKLSLLNDSVMLIKATNGSFEYDEYESFETYFNNFLVKNSAYSIHVEFGTDNQISNAWLEEWLDYGDYEDGKAPDNVYWWKTEDGTFEYVKSF